MSGEWRERLGKRFVIASVSGGKDSAAMSLWLHENGIEHERVFMDTGWEHELTYEYLRGPLTKALGPITEIRSHKGTMRDLVVKRGMFPSKRRRFCTQELKVFPMQKYIARRMEELGRDVVNCVGIRAAESESRSKMPEWEWSDGFDCETWRPLIQWTEQDVIAIHSRHGLPPNPLYLMGSGVSRVGCWPCIYARKSEITFIAKHDPARIDLLRDLEREVGISAQARAAAKGETLKTLPAWFQAQNPTPVLDEQGNPVMERAYDEIEDEDGNITGRVFIGMRAKMEYPCMPIDKVVEWARTVRGGKQFELFAAPPGEAGCVRWGLCDTHGEDTREKDAA